MRAGCASADCPAGHPRATDHDRGRVPSHRWHEPRRGRQRPQPVPVAGSHAGREMRMHADGRIDAQGSGQLDARLGRRQVPAGRQQPLHARLACRCQDIAASREGVRLEMAMGVDKTHHQMLRQDQIARYGWQRIWRSWSTMEACDPLALPSARSPSPCCWSSPVLRRPPPPDPRPSASRWARPERVGAGARLRHRGECHHDLRRGAGAHPRDRRRWGHPDVTAQASSQVSRRRHASPGGRFGRLLGLGVLGCCR